MFSNRPTARIISTGNLSVGDGSAVGFAFAGTIIIQPGQSLTIRDADQAQLGRLTELRSGAILVAPGGVEVGSGERLTGTGTLQTHVFVAAGGVLAPGQPIGVLRVANITLQPGAILEMDLRGVQPQSYDRLIVVNGIQVEQALLQLNVGSFSIPPGAVFQLIENASPSAIGGFFLDVRGTLLTEGSSLQVGGIDATISYAGGTRLTGLVLVTRGEILFVPLRPAAKST